MIELHEFLCCSDMDELCLLQVRISDSPVDLTGDIVFSDVVFSYPTRPDTRILDGLSCVVPAQKALAIVGESGSGKNCYIYYLEFGILTLFSTTFLRQEHSGVSITSPLRPR